jgi:hypothetical protein
MGAGTHRQTDRLGILLGAFCGKPTWNAIAYKSGMGESAVAEMK